MSIDNVRRCPLDTIREMADRGLTKGKMLIELGIHPTHSRALKVLNEKLVDAGVISSLTQPFDKAPSYICQVCGTSFKRKTSTYNKFCGVLCSGKARTQKAIERIEAGNGSVTTNATIRTYLTETRDPNCEKCGCGVVWCELPLTLHVDHIDGDSDNMSLNNVRLLCPNCHSQTPNYGSKNKRTSNKRKQYYNTARSKVAQV
jgi:Zn finger protein HypA/HybF involved in hydrogenase expression